MTTLFVTGGTGFLGGALVRRALGLGQPVAASYFSHEPPASTGGVWVPLDVRDALAVEDMFDRLRPAIVIHTAFQQSGPDLMAVTGEGAGHVARAAAAVGARCIHMSSDVIFDGEGLRPYTEDDLPAAVSPYGAAKAHAEALVAAAHPDATIVRTSLIYGFEPMDKITRFTLDVAAGRTDAKLFTDEVRCPVYVEDLASALLELGALPYAGVLNLAGAEAVSRHELGVLLAQAWGLDFANIPAGLSAESPVRRPRNCALDSTRAQTLLRTRLRGVREVLHAVRRIQFDG